jgi:hypothetical protein
LEPERYDVLADAIGDKVIIENAGLVNYHEDKSFNSARGVAQTAFLTESGSSLMLQPLFY